MTKILPNPEHFILKTPLYEKFKFYESDFETILHIEFFTGTLDTFCIECDKDSIFKSNAELPQVGRGSRPETKQTLQETLEHGKGWLSVSSDSNDLYEISFHKYALRDRIVKLEFTCTRDQKHKLIFIIKVYKSELEKIGQSPSIADLQKSNINKYRKILGSEKASEFTRAIGLSAHGVGIGSFVYLRRIFESQIELARSIASKQPDWDKNEYSKSRMDEKILLLKNHLPESLVKNRDMYWILSLGIHSLNEQQCLEYFEPIKLGIEIILDEKLQKQEKLKKESKTQKLLASIKSKIKK